jgi:ferri-bacillibactin esterase
MIRRFDPFMFAAMFLVLIAAMSRASASSAQTAPTSKPATLWYSEEFTVHSKIVGRDFLIQVAKPVKPQAAKVPVIYTLDGNTLFSEVAGMATSYGYFNDSAPAYVVGIGYPAADFAQWLSLRNLDLVHVHLPATNDALKGTGDGAQFQKFLQEELRPLIATRYPVDDRHAILLGHSFGGLFALHVLLNDPGAFSDYILCSPAVWAEPPLLEKASAFHSPDALKVFIGVGSKEEQQFGEQIGMVKNARDLATRLKDHASSVDVRFIEFDGQTHGTVIPGCLSDGLQFMLPSTSPTAGH